MIISDQFLKNYMTFLDIHLILLFAVDAITRKKMKIKMSHCIGSMGNAAKQVPLEERRRHPSRSFMTHNFLIRKEVINAIPFNEELLGYGHEDTLFGFELMKAMVPVEHIDNPVMHDILVTNEQFLDNTDNGIRNLVIILGKLKGDKEFIGSVTTPQCLL